jgi:hypothetical protein
MFDKLFTDDDLATLLRASKKPEINEPICRFAAAIYLRTWLFIDRRFLPFVAGCGTGTVSDAHSLRAFLQIYGVNRTFSPSDGDAAGSPERRLAGLQTTLMGVRGSSSMELLLESLSNYYEATPLSASSKCLWMIAQDADGVSNNAQILFDKYANGGLKKLTPTAHRTIKERINGSDAEEPFEKKAIEYEQFCQVWKGAYNVHIDPVRKGSAAVGGSEFAGRAAFYWNLDRKKIEGWCSEEWFHRRVFDLTLHVLDGRWNTEQAIKREVLEFDFGSG